MGTQVGNATPIDDLAAAVDERSEDSRSESTTFGESSWAEEGGSDY